MKTFVIIGCLVAVVMARPEPPKSRYGPPQALPQKYGPPAPAPSNSYGPPPSPQKEYGPPAVPTQEYGPPAQAYGPPPAETIVTKNVYVHVPPEEPEFIPSSAPIKFAPAKKHYKIIFIKAPNPPTQAAQIIPPQPQDEHKTLVYVLVKKPEAPQQPIIAEPSPTQPSKPEVYFIKYKNAEKPAETYGPPGQPASEYGPPSKH